MEINTRPYNSLIQKNVKKNIIILITIVVTILFAWVIISSLMTRANTGMLSVNSKNSSARIYLYSDGDTARELGTGSSSTRLDPGVYSVGIQDGDNESRQTATVDKKLKTIINLDTQPAVPQTSVLKAQAADIYSSGETLYYLRTDKGILNSYKLGDITTRPYKVFNNGVGHVNWVDQNRFYTLVNNEWFVAGSRLSAFIYNERIGLPASVSFNASGSASFITRAGDVAKREGPTGSTVQIASKASIESRTSIAPDGRIALYTPKNTSFGSAEKTYIYANGADTVLGDRLSGINNIIWSPDSTKFSFTDMTGAYIYNLSDKTITQILGVTATNPLSFTWTGNSTVMYAHDHRLWSFTAPGKTSYKLAAIEGTLNADRPFEASDDQLTYYYATSANEENKGGRIYSLVPSYNNLDDAGQLAVVDKQKAYSSVILPTVKNFDNLKDYGVTEDQINNAIYAISEFTRKTTEKPLIVEMVDVTKATEDKQSSTTSVYFTLSLDKSAYAAQLDYSQLTKSRLIIRDNSNIQLYDSGIIDSAN